MFKEGDQTGGHGHQLFGRNIHVIDSRRLDIDEIAFATAGHAVGGKIAPVIDGRVCLGDDKRLFAVGRQVIDVAAHAPLFRPAVRGLDEAEIVDPRESGQRGDQTDVRTLRRFHRTNASVVRGMHVTHFEAGAVAREAAGPQRREPALVGQLGQRVDLIHELGELAATEEIADHGRQRLWIDQFLRRHGFGALIEQRHALLDQTLGARQTDAALVGQQFAHRADAPAAQVVDVVQTPLPLLQAEQIFGRRHQVFLGQDARIAVFQTELLIDLVTAHPAQIVTLRVEEQALDQSAGVGGGRRIAGTQTTVDVFQGLLFILGGVFLEALDDDPLVHGGVHHADFAHTQFGDLLDHRFGQRFKRAGHHDPLLLVHRVFDENLVLDVVQIFGRLDGEFLDVVKKPEYVGVGAVPQGAEECSRQKFPAALLAIQIDIEQIAGVELRLIPRAAIWNNAEGMQGLAVGMLGRLKGNPRRAVQLADDDALGAVDDECALRGHQRQFAHEHLFFLGPSFILEQERDVQRRAIGDSFAQAFQPVLFGFSDFVTVEVQHHLPVVAFYGKDFGEDGLQAEVFPFGRGDVGLEKFAVRIDLDFDQVRRRDDFLDFSEVNPFCCSRWHFDLW